MKRLLFGIATALIATATSCGSVDTINSDEVSNSTIFRSYRAVFNKEDQQVWLSASFKVGGVTGTTVRLKDPSTITTDKGDLEIYDGDKRALNLTGTFYHRTIETKKPAGSYVFTWTRDDKKTVKNKLTMPKMAKLVSPKAEAKHSKEDSLEIKFNDVKLDGDTRVVVVLKSLVEEKKEGETSMVTESTKSGDEILISPTDLEKLPVGKAALYITTERRVEIPDSDEDEGGYLTTSMKSTPIIITITK